MKFLSLSKRSEMFVSTMVIALVTGLLPPNAAAQQQRPHGDPPMEAALAFSEGIGAYDKGDYATALERFTSAIKIDPKYSEAYYHRAVVWDEVPWLREERAAVGDYTLAIKFNPLKADAYLRRGMSLKGESAIEDFNMAILIRSDFAEAYYHRGVARAQSRMYWLRRIQSGGIKEADLKIYSKQIGIDSHEMAAVIAYLTNEIRRAIPDVIKSTELNPRYVEAYSYLAKLYSVLGEHDNAVAQETRVLAISPDDADAYYRRGLAYLNLKQYEKANHDFTEVISRRPDESKAYSKRVVVRFNLKDLDGALKDYVAVLRLKPSELFKGNYDETENDGAKIVAIELENFDAILPTLTNAVRASLAEAYYQRALALRYTWSPRDEDQKRAVADLSRALILHPSHVRAVYETGLALNDLELHAPAIKTLSELIRLQPQNAEAYYARGVAVHKLGFNTRALQDFSRSIALSPKFTKAYFERAQVYAELADQRSAIADFTRAIAIHSEFIVAYYLRGLAYEASGENQKAIADYLQVERLANPNARVEGDQMGQLGGELATIFHRGVARLLLARLGDGDRLGFRTSSEELAKKNFLESAEKDFTQVISARPEFANAYRQRGHAREMYRVSQYLGSGSAKYAVDKEGALADFTKAIELDPRYIDAYLSRAAHFEDTHKPEEAIRDYTRVTNLDPANAEAFYKLGNNHQTSTQNKLANLEAALENYSLAIRADPGYVAAYFRRAYLLQEKEPLRALADYTKIIQLKPDNATAYRGRAAIHARLKDYRSALADYTRAIEIDPSEPGSNDWGAAHTYADRAYVRFELGDGKGAVEDYRQALIIRPCLYCVSGSGSISQANKADTFFQKGLALLRRGDKQASRQTLEEAARLFYTQGDMPKYQSVKYHLNRF